MIMLAWLKTLMARNRRSFTRDAVDTDVVLTVGPTRYECQMRDVSPSGAFLSPALAAEIGEEGMLNLPNVAIETPVRIVRRTPDGVGVEFVRDNIGAIIAGWSRGQSPR